MKILIVEDNKVNLYMLETMLKGNGYEVASAENGTRALEELRRQGFDLVISDILMPVMDGFQLCREMKRDDRLRGIPFVFYTATYTEERDEELALKMGADRFIRKSMEPHRFIETIRGVLDEVEKGTIEAGAPASGDDQDDFKLYSERLVRKLEKKMLDLEKSEARYAVLFESSPEGIIAADMETLKLGYANPAMCRMLGYTREELETLSVSDIHPEEALEHVISEFKAQAREGKTPAPNIPCLRKDGTIFYANVSATQAVIDGAQCNIGFFVDVTELRQAEKERKELAAQLHQAQKMEAIGALAGGIAHDFNNILSGIMGYTQLAMDELPRESPVHEDLREAYRGAERARDLVKQILAFSHQGAEMVAPIQIVPVVKEVCKLLCSTLPATVEIRQDITPKVANIMADPTQIHQIIMNLCINAGHAMREAGGGILEVSLQDAEFETRNAELNLAPGSYLRLTVSDTGCGMAPEILERIFDPYFTTKEKGKGTGLGLAVVHGIVKGYGGAVVVHSEPGQGSLFEVYFPCIRQEDKPVADRPQPSPGGNERILFVDDELTIAKLGKRLLEQLGYRVEARTKPVEALELFKATPDQFDLVITDMAMPNMTGERLAGELMKIRPDIPVILCSGFSHKMSGKKAGDLGIKACIMKPLIGSDLAVAVRRAMDPGEF